MPGFTIRFFSGNVASLNVYITTLVNAWTCMLYRGKQHKLTLSDSAEAPPSTYFFPTSVCCHFSSSPDILVDIAERKGLWIDVERGRLRQ